MDDTDKGFEPDLLPVDGLLLLAGLLISTIGWSFELESSLLLEAASMALGALSFGSTHKFSPLDLRASSPSIAQNFQFNKNVHL